MGWYLGGIRIYVSDDVRGVKQTIARLQPLASGTIHHVFGYETETIKLQAKVVGETDMMSLQALTTLGASTTLTTDLGDITVLVSTVAPKRDRSISQTIDTTKACDAPVYTVDIEAYRE